MEWVVLQLFHLLVLLSMHSHTKCAYISLSTHSCLLFPLSLLPSKISWDISNYRGCSSNCRDSGCCTEAAGVEPEQFSSTALHTAKLFPLQRHCTTEVHPQRTDHPEESTSRLMSWKHKTEIASNHLADKSLSPSKRSLVARKSHTVLI